MLIIPSSSSDWQSISPSKPKYFYCWCGVIITSALTRTVGYGFRAGEIHTGGGGGDHIVVLDCMSREDSKPVNY